jgi:predicted ester cyclase
MKKTIALVALAAAFGVGCKKKRAEEGTMSGSSQAMGSGGAMGSATNGSGSAAGSGSAGSAAAAKPMTPDELAEQFDTCWGYFNDAKWDDFKKCYTADAVVDAPGAGMPEVKGPDAIATNAAEFHKAFPDMKAQAQLVLVNGHEIAAAMLMTGTNSGPMKTPTGEMPATNKKIGLMMGQLLSVNDTGEATHESDFYDTMTMMGQLNPQKDHPVRPAMDKLPMEKVVVIAKDDDAEKANLETSKKMVDAFNKHDIKALGDLLADDSMWSEQAGPKDLDKKANLKATQGLWKAFSDAKIDPTKQWAAGDYVVTTGTLGGTNDGNMPSMKLKKTGKKVSVPFVQIDKIEGGKIKTTWLFYQSMAFMKQLGVMPPPGAGAGSAAKPANK